MDHSYILGHGSFAAYDKSPSIPTAAPGRTRPHFVLSEDGSISVDVRHLREIFFHDKLATIGMQSGIQMMVSADFGHKIKRAWAAWLAA